MPSAVSFIQWDNCLGSAGTNSLFAAQPLTFNSQQKRLHELNSGDRLWLVSRCPDDQQYYFVAVLVAATQSTNSPASREGQLFGEYSIIADPSNSHDLGKRFPAEGLLRALQFETGRPIKHGASIGQSLQTLRFLSAMDEQVLDAGLSNCLGEGQFVDIPFGLWTKCDLQYAEYFVRNWRESRRPMAFLLYDSPPVLHRGAPVFIHSEKHIRLVARFHESQFVSGQKRTVSEDERLAERDRIWAAHRQDTIDAPERAAFDSF
jgi:hypothetical protein